MNKVEELIDQKFIKKNVFHYNNMETFKNSDGAYRKITLETDYHMGKTVVCFEYVYSTGKWACSSTYISKGESRGALLGKKALATQSKIIMALEKIDKELEKEKE